MSDRYSVRWLAPVAVVIAVPAYAATYFTVPQAQAALFPGQALTDHKVNLTPEQIKVIEKASGTRVREKNPKVWKASGGGWFYLDQVIGKHEFITYGLALTADGAVSGIEILDYRETYGSEVRNPKWRGQFIGKRIGAPLKLDVDIVNLSGATLSSRNVATGVRRLLNTHAFVTAKR